MEDLVLVLAGFCIAVGLAGFIWSVREIYLTRFYKPPKHKRRSTYVGR